MTFPSAQADQTTGPSTASPEPSGAGAPMHPFGGAIFQSVNWRGMCALYVKEVRRFFKVQLQTIWAPAVTTLLFLVIFTIARTGPGGHARVLGVPFADFLAPGLIMMGMMQNAFANSSFSLLVGKIQGTIIDYLMPPLSVGEVLAALVGGAVTRAILVGLAVWGAMLLWPGVHVRIHHIWAVGVFGLLGACMLAILGVLTSIWAEKFDHAAMIGNFVVQPLSLLSGTFYSIDALAPGFRMVSQINPFFYAISGFRYGFIDATDSNLPLGLSVLVAVNLILGLIAYRALKSGWRLKS